MSTKDIHETVRERYAEAAREAASGAQPGIVGGCGEGGCCAPSEAVFGGALYEDADRGGLPETAVLASLGCGNPSAVAELREGEVVLDLGSGGGIDVLLSARRVGPAGKAYGLDMTEEMLALARRNAAEAGATNVEFLKGRIEEIPLPAQSVDVIISNCVVNLSPDKGAVLSEAFRVLRPGGRLGISDVVAEDRLSDAERAERGDWAGCIAGALSVSEYEAHLGAAGFGEVSVAFTHEVNDGMHGAIVSAVKPADAPSVLAAADAPEARPGCC
jgi:arsenite methyltransferase